MQPLRLAQLSDFHWTCLTANPVRLFSKRLIGHLNWLLLRKKDFSEESLKALGPLLAQLSVDHLLLGGDLSSSALPQEFRKAKDFVEQLASPWIAIPGNHDQYTCTAYLQKRFYQWFSNPGATGPFRLQTDGVEAHALAPGWCLVALDTARPSLSSRGLFSKQQELRLSELLAWIPATDSILLFNHYPFFKNDLPSRSLTRGEALEAIVARDLRIKAYLHGHTHRHVIADLQQSGLPVILDGGCAAHTRRGSWNLLTLDDTGVQVEVYRWTGNRWASERKETIAWKR